MTRRRIVFLCTEAFRRIGVHPYRIPLGRLRSWRTCKQKPTAAETAAAAVKEEAGIRAEASAEEAGTEAALCAEKEVGVALVGKADTGEAVEGWDLEVGAVTAEVALETAEAVDLPEAEESWVWRRTRSRKWVEAEGEEERVSAAEVEAEEERVAREVEDSREAAEDREDRERAAISEEPEAEQAEESREAAMAG
ncbi:hypothetical protein CYMTET_44678 [Cymbomonas tetramitiformis]|uniref:Uncharacterized protein n=1 Tax=Cymbomonas tetramitiformis TaxID=36881 RepID=A0AAE0EZF8_9CHLO|nr:hypothetical protein CYMTET_44678 [Cymbomonas tetramitiformis]